MTKSDQRNRQIAKVQKERARANRASTVPGFEKLAKKDAGKDAHPKKQQKGQEDVSRPSDGKNWEPVFAVILVTLIGLIPAIIGFPWSSHPASSLWGTVIPLSLLNLVTYYVLTRRVWQDSYSRRFIKRLCVITGCVILAAALGGQIWIWTQPTTVAWYGTLTEEQRTRFVEMLKSSPQPRETITLSCSSHSEEPCIFAGQFLNLFKKAGWQLKVDGVERVTISKPMAGVVLFVNGQGKYEPSVPDSGLWTAVTPSRDALEGAFSELGLDPEGAADAGMPKGEIRIFFGIEPSKEEKESRRATRQELRRQIESNPEIRKLFKR